MARIDGPDWTILVMLAARAVTDALGARLSAAGFPGLRPVFGYTFRALRGGELSPIELAGRLGMTKQAMAKVLDEMEGRRLVERYTSPTDGRRRLVRLTAHGRAASDAALRVSADLETELAAAVGEDRVREARRVLLAFAEAHGGAPDAAARRARPVW
jgi:DNA-binding MarR family transcriptional regulator